MGACVHGCVCVSTCCHGSIQYTLFCIPLVWCFHRVADAKVSPVIPETFEKNVKAGKKAKGVSFMKSVAELRQQLPVDFLAQTGLNKKSLAQIKSMEMHVPRRKPTAVAVPLPSKNCHKPCVTNSCSGNGSRYSPVKMSHLDDLAASGSSSNGSSNSSSSRRNKSVGFASDSNVQCVPIAIPVSRSAQKVVATNFKQHTSTSQLSSSESRKRPASSLDRAPAVKKSKSAPADSTSKVPLLLHMYWNVVKHVYSSVHEMDVLFMR